MGSWAAVLLPCCYKHDRWRQEYYSHPLASCAASGSSDTRRNCELRCVRERLLQCSLKCLVLLVDGDVVAVAFCRARTCTCASLSGCAVDDLRHEAVGLVFEVWPRVDDMPGGRCRLQRVPGRWAREHVWTSSDSSGLNDAGWDIIPPSPRAFAITAVAHVVARQPPADLVDLLVESGCVLPKQQDVHPLR